MKNWFIFIFLPWGHWSWNKTITAFAFVQYESLFALVQYEFSHANKFSYCTQAMP